MSDLKVTKHCEEALSFYKEIKKQKDIENWKSIKIKPLWKTFAEKTEKNKTEEYEVQKYYNDGMFRLKRIIDVLTTLDKRGFMRSKQQREIFTPAIIGACLKIIFPDENQLISNLVDIYKIYGIRPVRRDVIIVSVRRMGKTYMVGLAVAALLIALPKMTITVYSPGQRASLKMLKLIKRMVISYYGDDSRFNVSNSEILEIKSGPNGDLSSVNALPGSVNIGNLFMYV